MTKKNLTLLLVCIVTFSLRLYAQTPNFKVSLDKNCSPVSAIFTNTSTGFSPSAVYTLNFGEGGTVSFPALTLTHIYLTGGSYTATLTVTDGGTPFTVTQSIPVYKAPVVNFSPNVSKVCANGSITFTSTSTAGDGTISDYLWDFGDGNIADTTANVVNHIYTSGSNIKAGLTVTNSYGCIASVTVPNVVTVLTAPKAAFSTSATMLCHLSDGVSFTNTTAGGATPTTYLWNFGDGATGNSTNAVHSYASKGMFTVKLIATSSEGCTDTSAGTQVTVASTKSGITMPALLCANSPLLFTDSSSPQTAHPTWLFDNKVVAADVHQYKATFTDTNFHTLQLLNVYGTCTDTATKVVHAQTSPGASPFSYKLNGFCNAASPSATFAEAAGGTKWEWDFNNTNDTVFHPSDFIKNPTYVFPGAGTYNVKLRVTDASGCTGSIRQPVTIGRNTIALTSTQGIFGCHNLTTTFKATSTTPIAQYNWMFSDDNSTSTADTPTHTFPNIGTYSAFVKIKTTSGCSDTARMKVYIGDEPNFTFSVVTPTDTTVCGNKLISLKVTGNSDSLVGAYYWNFGDAAGVYTPVKGDTIYTHQYLSNGNFTVSLAIKNHGCNDTVTRANYIKVLPPFAKISSTVYNCNDRLNVVLKESSIQPQTYSWNFGDKSAAYNYMAANRDSAVVHNFPNTGAYNVVLTTTNGSCTSKDSLWVRVIKKQTPTLSTTQTLLCANDTLHTLVSGMDANPLGYNPAYVVKAVQYSDTTKFQGVFTPYDISNQNPFHINISKINKGVVSLRLITVANGFSCPDTTTNYVTVQVHGPTAGFQIANNTPCLSDKAIFTDVSKGDGISPIKNWKWLYGDGMADTLTTGSNASHLYMNPGTYKVKLVVTDASRCSDTAYYPGNDLTVKGPQARFIIAQNPILPNAPETFVNRTDSGNAIRTNNSYTWSFGDGSNAASNKDSISHTYKQYSDDTVTLIAKSSVTGCTNISTSIVHVTNTNLLFTYTSKYLSPTNTCPPVLVNFKNKSVHFSAISWNFGDSLTAGNVATPTHTYYKPGVYKVTIYGYYPNNTYDSSWEFINIAGPSATLGANTLTGCGSRNVVFTAKTNNRASLLWDFGDGTSSTDSVAHHVYTTPNVYMPTLTVKDSLQCAASFSLATPVAIDSLHISLRKDSVLQCHQLLVNFIPTVFSIARNNRQALSYTWLYGNGSNASSKDTGVATYNHSGVYPVSLVATSPYGCKDTISTEVSYTDPHFASINGLSEFCENTPVAFSALKTNGADTLSYKWQFQKDSSTVQNPPAQLFTATGNNTVTLWLNKNGCTDTVYQKLTIHSHPDVTLLVSDSVVCLGSQVSFDAKPNNSTDTLSYFWNLGNGKDSAVKSASLVYTAAGTYPVLLRTTSNFGCKQELYDTVVVSPTPSVFINAPIDLCKNGTVTFTSVSTTATTPKFLWHFTDGTTSTKQNPEPKTYIAAGVDNIYLIASIGNCYDTAHHQLTVHDEPLVNLTASAQRVCFGDSVQLSAHNGKTYQWTINNTVFNGSNAANPRLLPSADTKVSVLAIDNFGCKNSDSLTVQVTKHQQLAVAAPVVNVCNGNKVSLSASGTDVYNWINGTDLTANNIANPSTIDSAQSKTYTVAGSDAYGCFTDTAHVQVIVRSNPVIQMANNNNSITTPVGAPTPLWASSASPIVKWNWQPTLFLSCNNCDAPTSKPRQNIHYQVEGTDSYGCKGSDTLSITVVCSGSTIGIPEAFSPNGDGRNDRFGVTGYGIKNIKHFVIFARNGNKVFERNNVSPYDLNGQWDGMYNNAYMPTGTYVYILEATCDAGEAYNVKGTVALIR